MYNLSSFIIKIDITSFDNTLNSQRGKQLSNHRHVIRINILFYTARKKNTHIQHLYQKFVYCTLISMYTTLYHFC